MIKRKTTRRLRDAMHAASFTLSAEQTRALSLLTKYSGESSSYIVRGLIPSELEIEAADQFVRMMEAAGVMHREKGELPNLFRSCLSHFLQRVMIEDIKYPLGLQVSCISSTPASNDSLLRLFIAFARAKMGVDGYRFMHITIHHSDEVADVSYNMVVSPEDTDTDIEDTKSRIYRHLKDMGFWATLGQQ